MEIRYKVNDQTEKKLYESHKSEFDSFLKEISNYLNWNKSVKINLLEDKNNSKIALGKTAYYNPILFEATIFCSDRHTKDIMRSLSHELIHHNQNCNGKFQNIVAEDGYAQKNNHLREMEEEAYLKGNMIFRDWEDKYKKNMKQKLNEQTNTWNVESHWKKAKQSIKLAMLKREYPDGKEGRLSQIGRRMASFFVKEPAYKSIKVMNDCSGDETKCNISAYDDDDYNEIEKIITTKFGPLVEVLQDELNYGITYIRRGLFFWTIYWRAERLLTQAALDKQKLNNPVQEPVQSAQPPLPVKPIKKVKKKMKKPVAIKEQVKAPWEPINPSVMSKKPSPPKNELPKVDDDEESDEEPIKEVKTKSFLKENESCGRQERLDRLTEQVFNRLVKGRDIL